MTGKCQIVSRRFQSVRWCQEVVRWCQEGVRWCHEGVSWFQKGIIGCQEGVSWSQEGVSWCQEGARWFQESVRKVSYSVRNMSVGAKDVFIRIPKETYLAPPASLYQPHQTPPLNQLVPKKLTHFYRSGHTGSCSRTPKQPACKQLAPPLYATRAARTSDAPCVGRSASSPPRLILIPTQTLFHCGPSRAPA